MRCLQTILDAILPHYLEFIKQETLRRDCAGAAREEIGVLCNIAVTMRALVSSCEPLARYVALAPKGSSTLSESESDIAPDGLIENAIECLY